MPLIYDPNTHKAQRHRCDLPDLDNLGLGSIARCDSCGRWFYYGLDNVAAGGWFLAWPLRRAWWWVTGKTR